MTREDKMIDKREKMFGLELGKSSSWNLRNEFNSFYKKLCSKDFRNQFSGKRSLEPSYFLVDGQPIISEHMIWLGMPNDFLTLILQRAILGIESYLIGAVFYETAVKGKKVDLSKIKNPYKLMGRSAVNNYYNLLPALVDPKITLKNYNLELWRDTDKFYRIIRNPLFHGNQIINAKSGAEGVLSAYQFLADIYNWIDSWHSPENEIKGGSVWSNIKGKIKPEI